MMFKREFSSSNYDIGPMPSGVELPKSLSLRTVAPAQHTRIVGAPLAISFIAALLSPPSFAWDAQQASGTSWTIVNTGSAAASAEETHLKQDPAGFEEYRPVHVALGGTTAAAPPANLQPHINITIQKNSEFSSMENRRFSAENEHPIASAIPAAADDEAGAANRMPLVALAWLFGIAVIAMGTVGRRKQPKR